MDPGKGAEPVHEPISMPNLLAQGRRSDPDLVWTTLTVDVPEVARMLRALLEG